ncbi:hypothetical protein BSL78_20342, partial [Apostichopus japonicus]
VPDNKSHELIYGAIQRGLIEVKTFIENAGNKWKDEDGVKLLLHILTINHTPEDERRILLANAEVYEALLEEKFDDEWGKEDWVKFLLVISQRYQQIDEKATEFFLTAIKTFKITPSDLESIFDGLNTPNEERIKVLTNKKPSEPQQLLPKNHNKDIFEPKADEVFLEVIKRSKIPNEQRIMILGNEKVSEYFLKQPLDKEEFRKDIMETLFHVIKHFMITPTEMKTILDKIEISEIKKEKIMTNKEIQRKLRKREEEKTDKQKQTEKTVNKDASAENVIKNEDVKADEDVKDEDVEKNQTDETGKPIENTERNEESDHVQAVQNPVEDAKEAATDKTDTEVDAEISKDITPTMGTNTSMDGN